MLRRFQADVLPALAAVIGAVDAVAVTDAALAIVFAGADPDDIRIPGIERDNADGVGAFIIKDWSPGGARVGCLPNAARSGGDKVVAAVVRMHRKADHAPRGNRR